MSLDYISVDSKHPTGTASVIESKGEAGFEIKQDVAWDYLCATPEIDLLATRCSAVAFGSLAQRSASSRRTIQQFVSKVAALAFTTSICDATQPTEWLGIQIR
jgi:fructokinase